MTKPHIIDDMLMQQEKTLTFCMVFASKGFQFNQKKSCFVWHLFCIGILEYFLCDQNDK